MALSREIETWCGKHWEKDDCNPIIMPDPQHRVIYRLENGEGQGPYPAFRSGTLSELKTYHTFVDFYNENARSHGLNLDPRGRYQFAFQTLDLFWRWWGRATWVHISDDAWLSVINVPASDILDDDWQCLYLPDNAKRTTRVPFKAALNNYRVSIGGE